ncbi:unnamed protein product, partial [Ectocarpus sp. 13 AM-2016]
GVFFDVLRQFGAPDEEMDRRRIYCKWKASQILKALKEGKIPTPGGAGEDVRSVDTPEDARAVPGGAAEIGQRRRQGDGGQHGGRDGALQVRSAGAGEEGCGPCGAETARCPAAAH